MNKKPLQFMRRALFAVAAVEGAVLCFLAFSAAAAPLPSSVDLRVIYNGNESTSSITIPSLGPFTLRAYADQDVGPTPYYIRIYKGNGTLLASCGNGTACNASDVLSSSGSSETYVAKIERPNGTDIRGLDQLTVTVNVSQPPPPSTPTVDLRVIYNGSEYPGDTTISSIGGTVTLKAYASTDVGPTPYYLRVYRGSTLLANCGSGTTCTAPPESVSATTGYEGRIQDNTGNIPSREPLTVTVPPPAFDYSISNGGNVTVTQGQSGNNTVTATLISGSTQLVSFSASGLPTGASASFSQTSCNPTCSSTVTISTTGSTRPGTYRVTVTSSPLNKTTQFDLVVNALPQLSVSCSVSPTLANTGQNVTWSASWSGGLAPYTYKWASDSGSINTNNISVSKTLAYTSTGSKSETITITSTDGQEKTQSCGSVSISYPPLTGLCKANKDTALLNENVTWSAGSITGGDGSYTYSWSGTNGLSCSGSSANCGSVTKAYSTSGNKGAILTITSAGASKNIQCDNFSSSGNWVAVNTPAITGSCSADKATATVGESVAWRANNIGGGDGSYTYSWSGTNSLSCSGQPSASCNSVSKVYSSSGDKLATLTVNSGGVDANFSCTNSSGGSRVTIYDPTLTINSSNNSVQIDGGTLQMQAVYDPDGSGPKSTVDVTTSTSWSSDDTDKATVNNTNQKGLITGESKTGNVKISAAYADSYNNNLLANKTLSVVTRPVVTCSPATQNVFTNQTANLTAGGGNNTYTWTASGGSPSSGSSISFSTSYGSSGNKTVTVRSGSQNANCTVNVSTPTLSVALTANPASGQVGSLNTTLTAAVSGSVAGTINYSFWWSCNNASSVFSVVRDACGDPSPSYNGAKFDGTNDNPKSVSHTYAVGTHTAKVIVERDALSAEGRATINAQSPPNSAPTVTPQSPQTPSNYCALPFGWALRWVFSDSQDDQGAYQIIVRDGGTIVKDTGRVESSSNSYAIPLGTLEFNKTYSWSVMVWDNNPYNQLVSGTVNGPDFTTIKHAAPAISFNWTPSRPSRDEQVTFTDATVASGGAAKTAWQWSFPADATILSGANTSQAAVKFSTSGSKVIRLTVTDSDGLQCTRATGEGGIPSLNTGRSIPQFRETVPR